jgi:H2-forming N5,N10-methylenetetrahydromethanopterin dehydrogenase-like enzyme
MEVKEVRNLGLTVQPNNWATVHHGDMDIPIASFTSITVLIIRNSDDGEIDDIGQLNAFFDILESEPESTERYQLTDIVRNLGLTVQPNNWATVHHGDMDIPIASFTSITESMILVN